MFLSNSVDMMKNLPRSPNNVSKMVTLALLELPHGSTNTLDPNNWIEFETRRVTEGTNPPGSEWTMVTLPTKRKKGDFYAFRDLVTVPEDLEPGQYVLSFRWDCEHTAQVWSSCANINVV